MNNMNTTKKNIDLSTSSLDEVKSFIANKEQLSQYGEIKLPYSLLKEETDLSTLADNHCLFCKDGEVLVDARPSYLPIVRRKSFIESDKLEFKGIIAPIDLNEDDEVECQSFLNKLCGDDIYIEVVGEDFACCVLCNNWNAYETKSFEKTYSSNQSCEIIPFSYYLDTSTWDGWNIYDTCDIIMPYPTEVWDLARFCFTKDDSESDEEWKQRVIEDGFVEKAPTVLNKYNDLTIVEIPYGTTKIESAAFENCVNLLAVVLPPTVKVIEDRAFSHCYNLQSINFPDSLTHIGKEAFSFCHCLRHVTIPSGVKDVGDGAFNKMCIEELVWNSPVALSPNVFYADDVCFQIEEDEFYECYSHIKNLILSHKNDDIIAFRGEQRRGFSPFTDQIEHIYWKDKDGGLHEPEYMFRPFLIPIGSKKYATDGKALFTKSMKTLIAIDPTLENYEIPEGVTTIEEYAFYERSIEESYIKITIPEGVTTIEEYAFYESSIKNIIIPESVTKIGSSAFSGCWNLRTVSFKGKTKSVTKIGTAAFSGCRNLRKVSFKDRKGITKIPANCFRGCTSLQTISLPSSIRTIEDSAFEKSGLKTLTLPSSVRLVNNDAFAYTHLEEITIKRQLIEFGTLWKDLSKDDCKIIAKSKGAQKTLKQIQRKRLNHKIKTKIDTGKDNIKRICRIVEPYFIGIIALSFLIATFFGIKALYGMVTNLVATIIIVLGLLLLNVAMFLLSLRSCCSTIAYGVIFNIVASISAMLYGWNDFWAFLCFPLLLVYIGCLVIGTLIFMIFK